MRWKTLTIWCGVVLLASVAQGQCVGGMCPTQGRGIGIGVEIGGWRYGGQPQVPRQPQIPQPRQSHPAIVKLMSPFGDEQIWGSGVVMRAIIGQQSMILTCAHVLKADAKPVVLFPDGTKVQSQVLASDAPYDCALLLIDTPPNCKYIPLAASSPRPGENVTMAGYPAAGRYHGINGRVAGYKGQLIVIGGQAQEGMSGGPICTREGIVGVICETISGPTTPAVTRGPSVEWIRWFVRKQGAEYRWALGEQPVQEEVETPPKPIAGIPDAPMLPVPPNLDRLIARLDEIAAKVEAIKPVAGPQGPKGDKGDTGPQGVPGKDGRDGKDAEVDYEQVRQIVREEIAATQPKTDSRISHIVLVRDKTGGYWPRMADDLAKARTHFSGIEEADPPSFATELPQLVAYKDGVPVFVAKGERNVSDVLNKIIRDDSSFLNPPH